MAITDNSIHELTSFTVKSRVVIRIDDKHRSAHSLEMNSDQKNFALLHRIHNCLTFMNLFEATFSYPLTFLYLSVISGIMGCFWMSWSVDCSLRLEEIPMQLNILLHLA